MLELLALPVVHSAGAALNFAMILTVVATRLQSSVPEPQKR